MIFKHILSVDTILLIKYRNLFPCTYSIYANKVTRNLFNEFKVKKNRWVIIPSAHFQRDLINDCGVLAIFHVIRLTDCDSASNDLQIAAHSMYIDGRCDTA